MADFSSGVIDAIANNASLAHNPVVAAVIQNLCSKRQHCSTEAEYLHAMRESLAGVNAYVNSMDIEMQLRKIDEHLAGMPEASADVRVRGMYYELDIPGMVRSLRESKIYYEPVVKNYVDSMTSHLETSKAPYFKYAPGFIATMSVYRTDPTVAPLVERAESYVAENGTKLMLLEAAHYLDMTGHYSSATDAIKRIIVENDFNREKMISILKPHSGVPMISEMIMTIQGASDKKDGALDIGCGDGLTKVYNYVGPALNENGALTVFIDGNFICFAKNEVSEGASRRKYVDGKVSVHELDPVYVYESMPAFYQFAKSFEFLGFNAKENGVTTTLRNTKIDFNINESGNVDLYVNNSAISDPNAVNFHQMFVLENGYVKNCANVVFENLEKIYNVEFIKMLVNESRSAAAVIMRVNENYFVYDFVDAEKRDVYKTDGYGLQKFITEKFGYDVRGLFGLQIDDVKSRVMGIDQRKAEMRNAIEKLEESYELVKNSEHNDGIRGNDRDMLVSLKEQLERQIVELKNALILLEDERAQIVDGERQQVQGPQDYKLGDTVQLGEEEGRVVALPKDQHDDSYMIFTQNGGIQKAQREKLMPVDPSKQAQQQEINDNINYDDDGYDNGTVRPQQPVQPAQEQKEQPVQPVQEQPVQLSQPPLQTMQNVDGINDSQPVQAQATIQQGISSIDSTDQGFDKMSADFKTLRSAIDTVRPEVREKFDGLATDMETLVKQVDELGRLSAEVKSIDDSADSALSAKITKKIDKIRTELEGVSSDLTNEFGMSAQQVIVSESLISSAYDKYISVVSTVADKLAGKVSSIVKKLSGDIIDLDADVKVLSARISAAKAKEALTAQVPVVGETQMELKLDDAQQKQVQDEAQQKQAQDDAQQKQVQDEAQQKQVNENFDGGQSAEQNVKKLESMSDDDIAKEYAFIFGLDVAEAYAKLDQDRQSVINDIVGIYKSYN